MAHLWLDVFDEMIGACAARGRDDLVRRLEVRRTHLLSPALRVLVVGPPKQGKSQLVNAIVNAPACTVGDERGSTVPIVVHHAEAPTAALVGADAHRTPVPVEEVAALASRTVGAPLHVEVGLPRTLLRSGLILVDSPPGADPVLDDADAVVLVCDVRREISPADLEFLGRALHTCPNLIVALTKIDLSPHWRQLARRSQRRLTDAGVPATVLPVSALNEESGFAALVARLREDAATKAERLAPNAAAAVAASVVEALAAPLYDLRTTYADRLQQVQRSVDDLRRQSVRWQTGLSDDIADLASDVEYDLRDRTRKIVRAVDEFFDTADPADVWDAFTPWLEENLRNAAEANFGWLVERSHWIAARIARNFAAYRAEALPPSTFWMPEDVFDTMSRLDRPTFGHFSLPQRVFSGLRGSYGGLVMAGLLTSLAGMPLVNVVSVGAGAVFAGKTLRDEGGGRLQRRQALAKAAVQRHIEDFFLKFSKECRDVARQVHRALRDHFSTLVDQLQDDLARAARTAAQDQPDAAAAREQEALEALYRKVRAIAAAPAQGIAA
jgi:hypothetical protein